MKFLELTISTTGQAEELVSSILWEYTSYGVSVINANDILELIKNRSETFDYIDDSLVNNLNNPSVLIKCYLDLDKRLVIPQIEARLKTLSAEVKEINFGALELFIREIEGDDWIDVWRKHYRPMKMGKVVICPNWIDYQKLDGEVVVKIDSNMAFGTGEHETTSMCIDFLQTYIKGGEKVIDVGTGTGILGITALLLGAKSAVMTDIDEVAVTVANKNVKINGVDDRATVILDNLIKNTKTVGDVIVANITADILVVLANDVSAYAVKNTKIILSGILKEKATMVVDKYISCGFEVINSKNVGEWVALCFNKI